MTKIMGFNRPQAIRCLATNSHSARAEAQYRFNRPQAIRCLATLTALYGTDTVIAVSIARRRFVVLRQPASRHETGVR